MSDTFDHEMDAWDQLIEMEMNGQLDEDPFSRSGFPGKGPKTCQYCGRQGLHWKHIPELESRYCSGWKLHTPKGKLHICYHKINLKGFLNAHGAR